MYMDMYYKHYITVDDTGRVTDGFSDAFRSPEDRDICINEHGSYQFRLFPGGTENPSLYEGEEMIPRYKYKDGKVIRRTVEEIEADIAAIPVVEPEPTLDERNRADIDYLAIMMGVEL